MPDVPSSPSQQECVPAEVSRSVPPNNRPIVRNGPHRCHRKRTLLIPNLLPELREVSSEAPAADLGVYRVSVAGYPVLRWFTRTKWERVPEQPDQTLTNFS